MAGFLYYIPNGTCSLGLSGLAARGLGYAFRDGGIAFTEVRGGPDHGNGVIAADEARGLRGRVRFEATKQEWSRIPGSEAWVGLWTDSLPSPADLLRDDALEGHTVRLLDGRDWTVPIARGWTEEDGELRWYHNPPRRAELDSEGRWVQGGVVRRYAPFWTLACRWEDARAGAVRKDAEASAFVVSFENVISAAVDVLQVNYAVGAAEVNLLGLLTEQLAVRVMDAAIDMPTRLAWVKKKAAEEPAGMPTGDGPAGEMAATARP